MHWERPMATLLFVVTLIVGLIEVASGVRGEAMVHLIPSDLFGGLVLIVVSIIFLRGLMRELRPFFYFGSLMLAIFGALYTLVFLAKGFDALVVGEEWCPMDTFRAEILMFPLAVPGLVMFNRLRKVLPP